MSYLPSIVLAAAGLLLLLALAFRVVGHLRRFRSMLSMVRTSTADRVGLVRARSAGVRVALAQHHRRPGNQ